MRAVYSLTILLLLFGAQSAVAADTSPAHEKKAKVELLFVQMGEVAHMRPLSNGWHKLTLQSHAGRTVWFTNRPVRKGGRMGTRKFVRLWKKGPDSFRTDNPEAVLSAEIDGKQVMAVLQLAKPYYDPISKSMSYNVRIVKSWDNAALKEIRLNKPVLFIDDQEGGGASYIPYDGGSIGPGPGD